MIYISVQRQAPCLLLCCTLTVFSNTHNSRLEMNWFLCCLQFRGANVVLTIPCSTKEYFFGSLLVCLPSFSKFCSWIPCPDAMLGYVYASHLFGSLNQNHHNFLRAWWGRTDTTGVNFCCSEWSLISG